MSDFNHDFLEIADIIPAFVPVDMQTADNAGQWVNMKLFNRLVIVLFKGAGTAGQDPVFTVQQALTNSGGTAKALNIRWVRTKIGAIASTPLWTKTTISNSNTYTPTSAANPAVMAAEIMANDLDLANGYSYVNLLIPDTGGNAQLGCAFYIGFQTRYMGAVNQSAIA